MWLLQSTCLRAVAFDYIVKDDDTKDRLWNTIQHLQEIAGLKQEVEQLRKEVGRKYDFSKTMIGNSDSMQKVFSMIEESGANKYQRFYLWRNRFW